jgi:hypothetical protein
LKILILSLNEKYLTQFLQVNKKVARQPKPVEIVQILYCTTNQILGIRFSSGEGSVVVFRLEFCVQAVRAVATASPIHVDGNEVVERLLLHISSSPKRLVDNSKIPPYSLSYRSRFFGEAQLASFISRM